MRWDVRRTYLEGLDQDESVPFAMQEAAEWSGPTGAPPGVQVRQNVDAGAEVINLTAMMAELEAGRRQQRGGDG
jgi:hypothetical protein